ncbi:MAG TPA: ComEC/Rec2 family competence protein, partial [Pyrinomonadaceae bacterium]|nr:ComEC/Rec2 family competence protein [Pyrinomonadaceae bacterium]
SLLGERGGLTRATGERFREGGTFHLLVVSGLHVTFLGGAAWWLTRFFTRRPAWRFAASALVVWAYAVAVGAESSVVRAALMFTALALAPVLGRPASALNALGGAALALLAWSPRSLFDPSFQLTFLSVLFIVAAAWPLLARLKATGEWRPTRATPHPPVCPAWWRALGEALFWSERDWRRELARSTYSYKLFKSPTAARLERWRVQRALRYVFAALVVSACVQAGLLPLSVIHFHRFTLASLLLNVFAGALMAALSLVALAAVALSALGGALSAPLVRVAEWLAWLTEHSVEPFAAVGVASLRPAEYAGAWALVYALYYAPLLFLLVALARWRPVPPAYEVGTEDDATNARQTTGDETERAKLSAEQSERAAVRESATRRQRLTRAVLSSNRLSSSTRALLRECQHSTLGLLRALSRFVNTRAALRLSASAFVLLFFVILAHPFSAARPDGRLRVDFLDVGQGDAALVTMPDGTTLLVDGGGRPRWRDAGEDERAFEPDRRGVGEAVVSEFLWRRGLDAVDYV